MSSPPPFRRQGTGSPKTGMLLFGIIGGLFLCCLLMIALLGGGGYLALNKSKPLMTCLIAFGDAGKAVRGYAADHGGKLPDAAKWQTLVEPYYAKELAGHGDLQRSPVKVDVMPAKGEWGCEVPGTRTGMAFNKLLSGKNLKDVKDAEGTILLFEVAKANMNANEAYKSRPPKSGPEFLMGERRGWIEVNVAGKAIMRSERGDPVQFDTERTKRGLRIDVDR